jgi:hypothetical protein
VIVTDQFIFVGTVDSVAPDKPGVVFKSEAKLKGDPPFDRLAVNLTGDDDAKKGGHTKVMLDRLEPGRKLVVFARKKGKRYDAMAFMEGTWFSMQGVPDDDGKAVRWRFLHCEPYLRRTFKGTTAELKKVVEDGLAKKADPPGVNEKEPPGFGPPVEKKEKKCDTPANPDREGGGNALPPPSRSGLAKSVALFAVIPSFVLVGPLAIVAALFPGVAARMAVGIRRWRAFLVVASTNSTLALAYWFLALKQYLPDWWVFGYRGFTTLLLASTAVGLLWAGRRYRRMAGEEPAITGVPGRGEFYALAGLLGLIAVILVAARLFGDSWRDLVDLPMREFTLIGIALFAATLYAAYRVLTASADQLPDGTSPAVRLSLSGESVGLGALFLGGVVALLVGGTHADTTPAALLGTQAGDTADVIGPQLADVRVFEIPDAHQVMSNGITVDGDRLYLGASKQSGFGVDGFVYCLDRNTGKQLWKFDNDEDMKPVFCTPTAADEKL